MVKLRFVLACLSLATAAGAHADGLPRISLPLQVAEVNITANGAWSDRVSGDETPEFCRAFQLSPAEVKQYFQRSRQVSERAYAHDLDASRCRAAGKLRLKDGSEGEWAIDLDRRGLLILKDGRSAYFHCSACTAAAFRKP